MSTRTFPLLIGGVLAATSIAMLAYAVLRPNRRQGAVLFGAGANLLGALFWFASVAAVDAPDWVQTVLGSLRALPFDTALAYVCYLVARSIGKKHPRIERLLTIGPYVLPACPLVMALICTVFFPQPALQSAAPGHADVLFPRVRNLVEAFFLALVTAVFVQEAFAKNPRLVRIQNTCLAVAGSALLLAITSSATLALVRAYGTVHPALLVLRWLLEKSILSNVALAGAAYFVGIVLYYSAERREAQINLCRTWIQHRLEVEASLASIFGDGLGRSESGAKIFAYFQRAASSLHLSAQEREQGRLTVGVLALMLEPRSRHLITELQQIQRDLLRNREVKLRFYLLDRIDGRIRYHIRDDALYQALHAALSFWHNDQRPTSRPPHLPPDWAQLAAVLSADVGFLPAPLRSQVLSDEGPYTSRHVLTAYRRAKRAENDLTKRATS